MNVFNLISDNKIFFMSDVDSCIQVILSKIGAGFFNDNLMSRHKIGCWTTAGLGQGACSAYFMNTMQEFIPRIVAATE